MTPTNEVGSTPTPSSYSTRSDKTPLTAYRILQGYDSTAALCLPDNEKHSGTTTAKATRTVLEEEDFTKALETIIQRDFYPEIPKLKAQNEYLTAVEINDAQKIRELQMKYSMSRQEHPETDDIARSDWSPKGFDDTPAAFETPDIASEVDTPDERRKYPNPVGFSRTEGFTACDGKGKRGSVSNTSTVASGDTGCQGTSSALRLDSFLSKYSSEDNASFDELMDEEERKRLIKYSWMYEAAAEHDKRYLPGRPQQLALCDRDRANDVDRKAKVVDNWTYKPKNDVLWVPGDAEWTSEELAKRAKMAEQVVVHENTRFSGNPFRDSSESRQSQDSVSRAAGYQAALNKGKVDPQGGDAFRNPSQELGPVVTPSPVPGIDDESPLMTWGEIDGTPFRLDGGDTPLVAGAGPSFKVPEVPKRDQLALNLAEHLSKTHRQRKKNALLQVSTSLVSPKIGSGKSIERLSSMSPAARRLATSKLGIRIGTDKALKAAYTPSPVRKSPRATPILRKTPSSRATPGSQRSTVFTADKNLRKTTPKVQQTEPSSNSLTDNLLDLNKQTEKQSSGVRLKAEDFF